ncbi:hypothetical protein QR680_009718 [Steinernema hermaphroditum]|uniref:Calponin-homology (CH) domain-containing protein n=1 Tax=Steinernema hermaphroditum TaxID=289476 RepID=A0AA39MAH1_9BILA|nr:hypothetical protein QR680_009718 [Steinernema hermaphroditum]
MSLSPGLDALERRRQTRTDERDAIQKKTFTKWVNKHLSKTGRNVADLFVDLQDGLNLIALLEALSSERIPREHGFTRFHRIQNVQTSLDFLKRKHIKLVNIRPEDIVEGNGKLTLGLIWTIILNFQVSVIKQRQQQELAESYIAAASNPTSPSTLRQVSLLLLLLTSLTDSKGPFPHCPIPASPACSVPSRAVCRDFFSLLCGGERRPREAARWRNFPPAHRRRLRQGARNHNRIFSPTQTPYADYPAPDLLLPEARLHPGCDCEWPRRSAAFAANLLLFHLLLALSTSVMYKVVRSFSRKAERKHESSGSAAVANGGVYGSSGGYVNGSARTSDGYYGTAGGQYQQQQQQLAVANGGATWGGGFSESSSYETREHYERKVQRVKKTRSERERSRSARGANGHQVSEVLTRADGVSARDALLEWARRATAGYPGVNVNNFTSSWRDGLAFNAILHRYRPNLINWNKISDRSVSVRERLDNAFKAAEREFGVPQLLDPEDVNTDKPDEKSIITYVSELYNALPHLDELAKYEDDMFEYEREAREFLSWVLRATDLMNDRQLPTSLGELHRLVAELDKFKSDDLPPKANDRERLASMYSELQTLFAGTDHMSIPAELRSEALDRAWSELLHAIERRYELLHERTSAQGSLADVISRLERGIGITNEKLDHILRRIEETIEKADKLNPSEIQRRVDQITAELNDLDVPIQDLFGDVDILKENRHPEASDYYRQVLGLRQRQDAYLERLRNQLLVRLDHRSQLLQRESSENVQRGQEILLNIEECIEWVRKRLDKLNEMEFSTDLEEMEHLYEEHKVDNHEIQDYQQVVSRCIAAQHQLTDHQTHESYDLLCTLESEYQQLRDLSAGRILDLDSLVAFMRAAQLELVWIHEREDVEVHRNWSDINQLDLPMLRNYYQQLTHDIEQRERRFNDVYNQGAALLNQHHPAVNVIDSYLQNMRARWDWLLSLTVCLDGHLRDATALHEFMEDAGRFEETIKSQLQILEQNFNRTDFSVEEGEKMLHELDHLYSLIKENEKVLESLTTRAQHISPLWQRGERIQRPMPVTAWCNYVDGDVHIRAGDECTLLDNADLIHWDVRCVDGVQARVPSVVFRIPPPDGRLTAFLSRLLSQYEKLRKLWEKKNRMVRLNMVLNTMKTIRGWDLDTFNSMDPEHRDAIIRALNEDANKLLGELDPNDPLALRLREELRLTNEHFYNLLNQSQREPEPDYSNQFDQKIAELLRKLEEAWKKLNDRVGHPVSKNPDELSRAIAEHKAFEEALQALDVDVSDVKELFRQLPNPTPNQRALHDTLNGRWEDLWDLSHMYVERLRALEGVLNGMAEVADIVRQHEITLNSFDDMPAALDRLRGVHSQLLEMNMVLQQQQAIVDSLNHNVALLRQHVARTRFNAANHPDVDRLEEETQRLTVRWENVCSQVVDRLKATEQALQTQMVYRSGYENEIAWLDRVEATIKSLRHPEDMKPEQYQQQLDLLVAEYSQLQERTEAIEAVNREGGKFIREAKGYDSKMRQFHENVVGIHGPTVANEFRRSVPQPQNGADQVTEELEKLNRRFAQLSSLILERRNVISVLIQKWKQKQQDDEERRRAEDEEKRRAFEQARLKALEEADRLRKAREDAERARQMAEEQDRLRREREAAEAARRAAEDAERRRREAEEEAERERRRREEEERRRREEEERRRKEDEDRRRRAAEEDAERWRREEEDRLRREAERRAREEEEAERERQRRKALEDEEKRRWEEAERLRREDEERRRKALEDAERERERLRKEREAREKWEQEQLRKKPKEPVLDIRRGQVGHLVQPEDITEDYEELLDMPDKAHMAEVEDEMNMYQEETEIKTQFYEMEGILHKQAGEIITFVEGIRQGLLDLKSGEFFDIVSGSRMSLEKAAEMGLIEGNFNEVLQKKYGIRRPDTGAEVTLLEAIQIGLYNSDLRQMTDMETGEILPQDICAARGIVSNRDYIKLITMGILKTAPISLESAVEQRLLDTVTGEFVGRFSKEKMDMKDALYNGYIQLTNPHPNAEIKISLSECIDQGFINALSGEFIDRNSEDRFSLHDACSRKMNVLNMHVPEVVNTETRERITLGQAIPKKAVNTRQGNFTDLNTRSGMTLREAFNKDLIARPMTLLEIFDKDMIDSEHRFVDRGTQNRCTLLEALYRNLLDAEVRHIVDPEEKDVVSIAEALERGLLSVDGKIELPKQGKTFTVAEAVHEGLLTRRVRHSIFDVKGVKDTQSGSTISFNEAADAGIINVHQQTVIDRAVNRTLRFQEAQEVVDPLLLELLTQPIGIRDGGAELSVVEAVAREIVDRTKSVFVDKASNRELSPTEAYEAGKISLRGAMQLNALFDVHPSLVAPSKKVDHKKRISRPGGQPTELGADQVKVTLAEAMKQGLIDSRTQRFRQGDTEMSLDDALNQGILDPSSEWIVPAKAAGVGPTIEEKVSETITETGQQLAPKIYPDKSLEESVTTVKRVRTTETTAVGGPGGVSVYRAITGGKGAIEVPADGFHIKEAERKGYIDLASGVVTPPGTDKQLSLDEAFELGIIDAKSISMRDPQTGLTLTGSEAIEKKHMDKNGFVTHRGRRVNLQTAIEENVVKVEFEAPALPSASKKVIQFSSAGGPVMSFRPVGTTVVEEAESEWSFDAAKGELVDLHSGERCALNMALLKGMISKEDLRVRDALTGREMAFEEAEKWGIVDSDRGFYTDKSDNKRYSFTEAAKQHRIYPTGGVPEHAGDAVHTTMKVQTKTQVSKKEALSTGPSNFAELSLTKAIALGQFDAGSGMLALPDAPKEMTIKEAVMKGFVNPYGTTVVDKKTGRELTLLEAMEQNIVDGIGGSVTDTASGRQMDLKTAVKEGVVKGGKVFDSLEGSLVTGRLDMSTGKYQTQDGRSMDLHEAIRSKLIDTESMVIRDPVSGEEVSFNEAIAQNIVDPERGVVFNRRTYEETSFPHALTSGLLVSAGAHRPSTRPAPTTQAPSTSRPTSTSSTSKIIEQKLTLTPYVQPPAMVREPIRDQRTVGDGRREMLDLGGGKQVMVKVVRDDSGVEKGEYVDPSTGMKFTIQLTGDPYVTETKTMVKSTAQVQSVELEPHAEFVGIDKIRDKRNGRIMSLQDAQRMGIARVDKKGKQTTKTYAVFRSNIQNAVTKGVIDSRGEKTSLEDAIRLGIIDVANLSYVAPNGEHLTLAQAANRGLLDVTLSEILPKGVCNPANGESIPISKAIDLGIVNARTGEVRNPFTKEKLTWLDIVKPVYASLTMEGVYDPTKGYAVSVTSAIIDGLIDTRARLYHNPITNEKISLQDASSKGLIDQETLRVITKPFLSDYRSGRVVDLIDAVDENLIDARNRTIQISENVIIPIPRAVQEGKIPKEIGEKLRRVDKMTFAEALGKGIIDVVQNSFTDPDSGKQMTIEQAVAQGFIDTGSVEAMEGFDERNLANVVNSVEFDENSGRIRDKNSGLYLTFRAAVDKDVIDGDSLLHDLETSQTMTIREALNRGRIDGDGKYVDTKTQNRLKLKDAVKYGMIALIASPMQAAQAVTEAVKRRDAEGYKFKIEAVDSETTKRFSSSSVGAGQPRFRTEESTIVRMTPRRAEPSLSVRLRSSVNEDIRGDKARSFIHDPQGYADLQNDFLANLENASFNVEERIIEDPAQLKRVSVREATESGLLDVTTGEIVHPSSNRRYSIPRAVHMRMIEPEAAKRIMESLNMSLEELQQPSTSYVTEVITQSPGGTTTSETQRQSWTKTVNWAGQPAELRASRDPLAPYTTYSSTTTTSRTSDPHDAPLWTRRD